MRRGDTFTEDVASYFLPCPQSYHRTDHLLQRDAAVLEGVSIIIVVIIVIIRIKEILVFLRENKRRAHIRARQLSIFRVAHFQHIAALVLQVSPHFVAQVRGGFAVAANGYMYETLGIAGFVPIRRNKRQRGANCLI